MKNPSNYSLTLARASGHAASVREGISMNVAASGEVESRLSTLVGVTIGMFIFAIAAVVAVGIWLF